MALNLEAVKKQVSTVGSPIFEGREKAIGAPLTTVTSL